MSEYTTEKNVLILLSLLKQYKVRKIVASPGTTNITFIASAQSDPFFEIYSSVDERSAAYIACGLSAESGDPVVLSCTGATASRNYMPGLTEAFYRKLPILAVTSTQSCTLIGQHIAQVIDRSSVPNDIVKQSFLIPLIKDARDEVFCMQKVNSALQNLTQDGGGPVHINLETRYTRDFSCTSLPHFRKIERITPFDDFPELPSGKIGIFVGAHKKWNIEATKIIDEFCASHDAVVLCDHTSAYKGAYRILTALAATQNKVNKGLFGFDLIIHIGEISGDYDTIGRLRPKEVWRVSPDGIMRDTFNRLTHMFVMPEFVFFKHYAAHSVVNSSQLDEFKEEYSKLSASIPDLPFSNIWIAHQISNKLPLNSNLYLGILNTLRSWNLFEISMSIDAYSNVGGFGIDGMLSSMLGSSLADPKKINIGIVGDLGFFYDMNVLGNRHVGKNFRILLVNNGTGTEFKNYNHFAAMFGERSDQFIAGTGHYGNQSPVLVKHYAEDLGFVYLSAKNKNEFCDVINTFLSPNVEAPMLLEVFTKSSDESTALKMIKEINCEPKSKLKSVWDKVRGK